MNEYTVCVSCKRGYSGLTYTTGLQLVRDGVGSLCPTYSPPIPCLHPLSPYTHTSTLPHLPLPLDSLRLPLTGLEDGRCSLGRPQDVYVCETESNRGGLCVCVCERLGLRGKMPSLMYVALMDPKSFETVAPRDMRHNRDYESVYVTMCLSMLCLLNKLYIKDNNVHMYT